MSRTPQAFVVIAAVLILGFGFGLVVQKQFDLLGQKTSKTSKIAKSTKKIFDSQQAFLFGQITAVDGKNLTVKNLNNNTTGTILASDRISILKPDSKKSASSSANLSDIGLNQDATITLEMINGNYQVTLVQYVSPAPTIPPDKSSPAKTVSPKR